MGISHLEPPDSLFASMRWHAEYELSVARQLSPGEDGGSVHASTYCLPSFEPEWAVFLMRNRDKRYSIQFSIADEQIYDREINQSVQVRRSNGEVSDELANRISGAFELTLAKVRYPSQSSLRCDGTTLHFSAGGLAGQTWSPTPNTMPGMLTSLALAMRNHTIWPEDRFDDSIAAMTAASEWIEANHDIEPMIQADQINEIEVDFTESEQ